MLSNLDLKELIRNISPSIPKIMRLDAVGLSLPTIDGKHLEVHSLDFPDGKGQIQPGTLLPLESLPGQVFLSGKTWVGETSDIAAPPSRYRAAQNSLMTHCSLPLTRRGCVLGVLSVARLQNNSFASGEVDFLIQIAGQIAIAIDNALAYQKISELTQKLAQEKLYLEDEIRDELNFEEIVGNSPVIRRVHKQVEAVAPTDSTVQI